MLDMFLSCEVVTTDFDTIKESRQKLLEYSANNPDDEILIILCDSHLVGLKGKYKKAN